MFSMKQRYKRVWGLFLVLVMIITILPIQDSSMQIIKAATEDGNTLAVDMSSPYIYGKTNAVKECSYDVSTGAITATNAEQFQFQLPKEVNKGETITVTLTGSCGTVGFRSWLSDDSVGNNSNNFKTSEYQGFDNKAFTIQYELTANTYCDSILFKGPSYGTKIDTMTISSLEVTYGNSAPVEYKKPDPYTPETEQDATAKDITLAKGYTFTTTDREVEVNSLLAAQRFIADPTAIEYNGRLYVYGTTDEIEFDAKANVVADAYNTHTLSCISTSDMVNWKDEGKIDVTKLTTYATRSWAPTIASKVINGKTQFFLYYTTGGDGIGVLTADSPTGPWKDPIGKRLIDRSTPTCTDAEVPWLFDPSVFVDDDGTAYIYFGGGSNDSMTDKTHPTSGRICKLGSDMTSLSETPHQFAPYYYFEDNEINKIGNTYYYSYSTNWSADLNSDQYKTGQASIGYYTADNPYMNNATFHGAVLQNPGAIYGNSYNNHHHMFQFKGKWYIAYHTTYLEQRLYGTKKGYRNLHIDELKIADDGTLSATPTYAGVNQVADYDGTVKTSATTMARSGGLTTSYSESMQQMVLDKINTGDWQGLKNVNFTTNGVDKITMSVASQVATGSSVEVYLDSPSASTGTKVATITLDSSGKNDTFTEFSTNLTQKVTGKHNLYFVFRGSGYQVASWQFSKNADIQTPTTIATNTATATPTTQSTAISVGKKVTIAGFKYTVTDSTKKEVKCTNNTNQKAVKATVPATIKINGEVYKVTSITKKAFVNCNKLKEVTIGKNVTSIGEKAFYKVKTLKKMIVKSSDLKSVGKNAFTGIYRKAVFKVPSKKLKAYKKLFNKKTGITSKMKIAK